MEFVLAIFSGRGQTGGLVARGRSRRPAGQQGAVQAIQWPDRQHLIGSQL